MPSSEAWGGNGGEYGKYPVKIYTIDGVLIYQADNGANNTGKTPSGGVLSQNDPASSMLTTIANPITLYGNWGAVINQAGHSGDLYNYYWTSYSRGVDGRANWSIKETQWHNAYLDGYIPLRVKSIYDPCPYLYRIPSNGTWNQFSNAGWTGYSYLSGTSWTMSTLGKSWLSGLGRRYLLSGAFDNTGSHVFYYSSTKSSHINGYALSFNAGQGILPNWTDSGSCSQSVRCIEGFNVTFVAPKVTKMPKAKSTSASL